MTVWKAAVSLQLSIYVKIYGFGEVWKVIAVHKESGFQSFYLSLPLK